MMFDEESYMQYISLCSVGFWGRSQLLPGLFSVPSLRSQSSSMPQSKYGRSNQLFKRILRQ